MKTAILTPGRVVVGGLLCAIVLVALFSGIAVAAVDPSPPVANFSFVSMSDYEPATVYFTDLSASNDGIEQWAWDFGDGSTSDAQNPEHVFVNDGVYWVTLTVYEVDGSIDDFQDMVVVRNEPPQIEPIPDQNVGAGRTVSLSVNFTDPGVLDTHWAIVDWGDDTWEYMDVSESNGSGTAQKTHYYHSNGVFYASVQVSDDLDNNFASFSVTVDDPGQGRPDLRLFLAGSRWDSYADYLAGRVTVDYEIYNAGSVVAYDPASAGSRTTNGVYLVSTGLGWQSAVKDLWYLSGGLLPGERFYAMGMYYVPPGVGGFMAICAITANDPQGAEYVYPEGFLN